MSESGEQVEVSPELAHVVELLRGMDDEPVDTVAAPTDLWSRIDAAVRADEPTDGSGAIGAGTVVEYRIDRDDVVVAVGADWVEFARENEAHELAAAPTGRTLWDSIDDESLRDLWRAAVAKVRSSATPITLPFRCDGPNARRWFEMTLTPLDDDAVCFRSELVFEMARPELPVLLRHVERDDDAGVVEICTWCASGNDGGVWRPVEELLSRQRLLEADPPPAVTHGICPDCVEEMSAQLLIPQR